MCPGRLSGWDPPQNPYVDPVHHLSRRRAYSLGGTLISQRTHRKGQVGPREKAASASQTARPHQKPTLMAPWILDFYPPGLGGALG